MRELIVRTLQGIVVAAASWSVVSAQQPASSQVTAQDLREGLKNPTRWITYGGDYANLRHSPTPIVGAIVLSQQMIDETYYPTRTEGRRDLAELID